MENEAEWRDALRGAVTGLQLRSENDLERFGQRVASSAKRLCPVDTGRLRSSITTTGVQHESDDVAYVEVGTNVKYAHYIEFGTSRMSPQPFLRPALLANAVLGLAGRVDAVGVVAKAQRKDRAATKAGERAAAAAYKASPEAQARSEDKARTKAKRQAAAAARMQTRAAKAGRSVSDQITHEQVQRDARREARQQVKEMADAKRLARNARARERAAERRIEARGRAAAKRRLGGA